MKTEILDKLDAAMFKIAHNEYGPSFIHLNPITYAYLKKEAYNKYGGQLDFKYGGQLDFKYYNGCAFKFDDMIELGVFYISFKF